MQEVSRKSDPVLATGQIEGGVAGDRHALYENVLMANGRMANGQMTNYIMPTAADIPDSRFAENLMPLGGQKGISELPMDGPAPPFWCIERDGSEFLIFRVPEMI